MKTLQLLSLKNQAAFDLVNRYGSKHRSSCSLFVIAKSNRRLKNFTEDAFFIGMKVSRKLSKKATIRNKIKRRIRHLCRNLLHNNEVVTKGIMAIVIPRKGFDEENFDKLQSEFIKAFSQKEKTNLKLYSKNT